MGTVILAGCGGEGRSVPTAIPADVVRPSQAAPIFHDGSRRFTVATPIVVPAPRSRQTPVADGASAYIGPTPTAPSIARQDAVSMGPWPLTLPVEQRPTALGIAASWLALRTTQDGVSIDSLPPGSTLTVTGRSADGRSLAVFTSAGVAGWVTASAVILFGDDDLQAVDETLGPGPIATLLADAMAPVVLPTQAP